MKPDTPPDTVGLSALNLKSSFEDVKGHLVETCRMSALSLVILEVPLNREGLHRLL